MLNKSRHLFLLLFFCLSATLHSLVLADELAGDCRENSAPSVGLEGQDQVLAVGEELVAQNCLEHERGFAQFINEHLATQSISFLENITCEGNSAANNCSQAFEEIALNVSAYRAANDGMHRALFSHWYEGQDDNRKSMIRNCFTQNEDTNSIDPYTIRFDNHHSQLQTRSGIPATTCVGLQTLWQNQVRQELPKLKANPSDYGVSPIDAFVVEDFENSRLKAMVDDTSWSNPNMSQQEMRQRVYDDLREIPARMLAMGEQIENFSNSQLEHIYLFRDFYEQEYLPSLSNLEVGTLYPTCMQRNDRGICFRSVFADEEEIEEQHVDRCLSRAAELGLDLFIPGHMVVSGQRSINFAREALVSGLINYQDYFDESSSYAGEMLMGIPVGGVVSAALPRAALSVGRGAGMSTQSVRRNLDSYVEGGEELTDASRRSFLVNGGAALGATAIIPGSLGRFIARSADDVAGETDDWMRRAIMQRYRRDMVAQRGIRDMLTSRRTEILRSLDNRWQEHIRLVQAGDLAAARAMRAQDEHILEHFRNVLTRYIDDTNQALGRHSPESFTSSLRRDATGRGFASDNLMFVDRETRTLALRMRDYLDVMRSH